MTKLSNVFQGVSVADMPILPVVWGDPGLVVSGIPAQ